MDDQLKTLMGCTDTSDGDLNLSVRVADEAGAVLEIFRDGDDPNPIRHALKPLAELYGRGSPGKRVDPQSHTFLPLFLAIEESILKNDNDLGLTDGGVQLALDKLAMGPESDVHDDTLAHRIQVALRMNLSLNDYSRDEVRQALRRIRKSLELHRSLGGQRGYLDFLHTALRA